MSGSGEGSLNIPPGQLNPGGEDFKDQQNDTSGVQPQVGAGPPSCPLQEQRGSIADIVEDKD
jgi:hypothetical protein